MLVTFIMCMMIGGGGVMAYATGPPVGVTGYESLCEDMYPVGHANNAGEIYDEQSRTNPPFVVEFSGQDCYYVGTEYTITVRAITSGEDGYDADADAEVEGVFLQAKTSYNATGNYGTFTTSGSNLQTLSCFDREKSAVSHSEELHDTESVSFVWRFGNEETTEELVFAATVVRHKDTFWVGIESDRVKLCSATSLTVSIMILAMSAIFAISTSQ